MKPAAIAACAAAAERLARATAGGPAVLIGTLWPSLGGRPYNAVALLADGVVQGVTFKRELPTYGVFDEHRVFARGRPAQALQLARRVPGGAGVRGHLAARGDGGAGGRGRRRCCWSPTARRSG
jgi:predicted amidohydrolase